METWAIDVYWWERPENAHAITLRVERLLQLLASVDPELSRWELQPISNHSRQMLPFDSQIFEQIKLEHEGRSRRDDGTIFEKFGYSACLLTPSPPESDSEYCKIDMRVGVYGIHMSANSCSVLLDNAGRFDGLRTIEKQCAILSALVHAWDPDYGVATSIDFQVERKQQGRMPARRTPGVGWLTYLPARRGPIPELEPPATTVPLGGLGTIVVASPERVSVEKPETIAAVDAVA